jgi:glycosyltransferase involved in cell wall biosynthesis
MKILFIHDNFPAQFGALGMWLASQGWDVTFATNAKNASAPGIRVLPYGPHREPSKETHPYAQPMDKAAINGQGFARAALKAREAGYAPDIIVAHSGWGGGTFARDVFPRAAFVAYCEWWYRFPGADTVFLSELTGNPVSGTVESPMLESARNAPIAMDLTQADAVLCPTRFQASQFPARLQPLLTVQHDGIDTAYHAPDVLDRASTLDGLVARDTPVVTYATRGMEPHRGFPQFMASLPPVLAADPRTEVVIAGENRVAYGGRAQREVDWKARALEEHDLDPARVHFVGLLDRARYRRLLRRSNAHVYLTVPFVLSWSMIEAMSLACPLVLSDTAPVREFADADSATLVPMADPAAIARGILATLGDPGAAETRARAARAVIDPAYSITRLWPEKARLFTELARA